jgi:dTDP-4-amino-4,6-dideoxygalactose transaminase
MPDAAQRQSFLETLNRDGIGAAFHYVPLHSSPAGRRYGRRSGTLETTDDIAARLVRLPSHLDMSEQDQSRVIEATICALGAAP